LSTPTSAVSLGLLEAAQLTPTRTADDAWQHALARPPWLGRSASTICAQVRNIGDMQYLRSKTFDTVWFLWTALFVPTVPILILFGSPTRYVRALAVVWTQGTLILLRGVVGLKYLQRRRENIPRQPCVIICNHQSPWETIAFIAHFAAYRRRNKSRQSPGGM
jgi:hypothetical protein